MVFAQEKYFNEYKDCPPENTKERKVIAYHFVQEPLSHSENFKPVLIKQPERRNTRMFKKERKKCEGYALSMWENQQNAERRLSEILDDRPMLKKIIGNHIAKGILNNDQSDGMCEPPSKESHFNFYRYENTDLRKIFTIIKQIK